LSYLDDPANQELIWTLERNGREWEARLIAGQLTEQERRNYEFVASLNSGLGDADLT
jgi:hypothetical protein